MDRVKTFIYARPTFLSCKVMETGVLVYITYAARQQQNSYTSQKSIHTGKRIIKRCTAGTLSIWNNISWQTERQPWETCIGNLVRPNMNMSSQTIFILNYIEISLFLWRPVRYGYRVTANQSKNSNIPRSKRRKAPRCINHRFLIYALLYLYDIRKEDHVE